ncbi:MAG: regulatory protein RecX [Acidobacteria bacterium]|nr:regulatory protein RecX [Acidobacteriota bacterium]
MARRARSTHELRQKLAERAARPADLEPLLEDLTDRAWLDDRRFAREYARTRAGRRYGRYRIAQELRRKGVAAEHIAEALAEVFPGERDERVLVRKRIEKRLKGQRPPYPERLLRSLYASLLRAGFPSAIIRDELLGRARGRLPDELALDEDERA